MKLAEARDLMSYLEKSVEEQKHRTGLDRITLSAAQANQVLRLLNLGRYMADELGDESGLAIAFREAWSGSCRKNKQQVSAEIESMAKAFVLSIAKGETTTYRAFFEAMEWAYAVGQIDGK